MLLRQRSLVIKELMMGHGHKGCLMTSKPVQNELRKLLHKTMKSKDNWHKAPPIKMIHRWVKKRRSGRAHLGGILESRTANEPWSQSAVDSNSGAFCCGIADIRSAVNSHNGTGCSGSIKSPSGISRPGSSQQPGTSSDSYLTPIHVTPSRRNPQHSQFSTALRRSPSRQSSSGRHERAYQTPNHNSVRYKGRQRSSRKRSGDFVTRRLGNKIYCFPETDNLAQNSLKKSKREHFFPRKQKKADHSSHRFNAGSSFHGKHHGRRSAKPHSEQHHQVSSEGMRYSHRSRTSSSPAPTLESGISRRSCQSNCDSSRPDSRLQRLRRAWQKEDVYTLNPFDSWRLRQQPTHRSTSPPRLHVTPSEPGLRKSKHLRVFNHHSTASANRHPIRQQNRNSQRMKKETPSPSSRRHHYYDEIDSVPSSPPPRFSHLLPHPTDVFFRTRSNEYLHSPHPSGPVDSYPNGSPFVLGWLQVPSNVDNPTKSMMFRKAPWLKPLQGQHR
ncbi:hypothetical protein OTU49_007841 [Cherax quadricarinatus]|uniref:Uncharacterized protein n=1 Tax=Cherax quadricarinatus TaxID=27406 RepID=A0AAW0WEZ6_CHEQU